MLLAVQSCIGACVVYDNLARRGVCYESLIEMAKLGVEVTRCGVGRWAVPVCGGAIDADWRHSPLSGVSFG